MLKPLIDHPLMSITANECRMLILSIAKRSPWQARAALRLLKACLKWAIESGRYELEVSPCDRIKAHKLLGPANSRQRTLTDAELLVLWQATEKLSYVERDYVRVLLMTGQRRGEVSGMRCREIDWQRKLWKIPQERFKTGEIQIVPLSDELMRILELRPCGTGERDHLFSANNSGAAPLQGFHHAITRLRREIRKIDLEIATEWVVHDLRRTVRTRLASLGISDTVDEYVIGHRPRGIAATYNLHRYESETPAALETWQRFLHNLVQPSPVKK